MFVIGCFILLLEAFQPLQITDYKTPWDSSARPFSALPLFGSTISMTHWAAFRTVEYLMPFRAFFPHH